MVLIGALIGGMTNSLAIKMLFRPHQPIFIGERRLPFTPGLIPKRRDELASQLGRMVVDHLLTPESIQNKLAEQSFQANIISFVEKNAERLLTTNITLKELSDQFELKNVSIVANEKIDHYISTTYENFMKENRLQPLKVILNDKLIVQANTLIETTANQLLDKLAIYFASEAGKDQIEQMVNDYFRTRGGKLSGMIQMFLGNMNIAEKIQPELVKFLNSDQSRGLVVFLLKKEWEELLEKDVQFFEQKIGNERIVRKIQQYVKQIVQIDHLLDKPIGELLAPYKRTITEKIIPLTIKKLSDFIGGHVTIIMDKLGLDLIVRDQVASFPVERLEEMVLSISRRELKMITYLGALLGGLIGFVQGLIVLIL